MTVAFRITPRWPPVLSSSVTFSWYLSDSLFLFQDAITFVDDHRTGYLPPADKVFEEYSSSKGKTGKKDSGKPAAVSVPNTMGLKTCLVGIGRVDSSTLVRAHLHKLL